MDVRFFLNFLKRIVLKMSSEFEQDELLTEVPMVCFTPCSPSSDSLCISRPNCEGVIESRDCVTIRKSCRPYSGLNFSQEKTFTLYAHNEKMNKVFRRGIFSVSHNDSTWILSRCKEVAPPPPTMISEPFNGFSCPTTLFGIRFRSKLEARFANALTCLNIRFVYERVMVRLESKSFYKPDFFIPNQQLYIELKPERPHVEEMLRCEQLSECGVLVTCVWGDLDTCELRSESKNKMGYAHKKGFMGMAWFDGQRLAGDVMFVRGRNQTGSELEKYWDGREPHLDLITSARDERWKEESLLFTLQEASKLS